MRKTTLVALALLLPTLARAETAQSASRKNLFGPLFDHAYARLSVLGSRSSQERNFRNMKAMSSDDGGGEAEKKIPVNQNFVSAIAILRPAENHEFFLAALQSLDSTESRKVAGPMGDLVLPGRILALRYHYSLSDEYSLSLGSAHIDTIGFTDPFFGLGYSTRREGDWLHRIALQLAAPVTESSRRNDLYTKATLRASTTLRRGAFMSYAGLSHSRPFYRDPGKLERPSAVAKPGNARPFLAPSDLDIVLTQRESSRSSAYLGTGFRASRSLQLRASGSLSLFNTFKNSHLWITRVKPIGLTYTIDQMELGAELDLVSAIEKYRSPSLPKHWSLGMNLSYSFGEKPAPI
jgi:hypothetical protein